MEKNCSSCVYCKTIKKTNEWDMVELIRYFCSKNNFEITIDSNYHYKPSSFVCDEWNGDIKIKVNFKRISNV